MHDAQQHGHDFAASARRKATSSGMGLPRHRASNRARPHFESTATEETARLMRQYTNVAKP